MAEASALHDLVAAELAEPVDARVSAMAAAIAARYPGAAWAVLFYGSCLRTSDLDGQMLDFYLIVSDYRAAYGKSWMAPANRLIPPNVFPFHHEGLTAKYAVLSEADFRRECSARAKTVSVWARFAQPSRLVWAADDAARTQAAESIALAAPTLLAFTLPMLEEGEAADPLAIWRRGLALTYECELRAERKNRSSSIVDRDPDRYRRFAEAALPGLGTSSVTPAAGERIWRRFRRRGKRMSVLRLAKASATFAGGIDYLAWKINRHAGTDIRIASWQRRWPLLGAVTLLPRLLKRGAIR
ncbi:MAG TPA: hypothetical protein VNT77_01295 [Allosphingosinicella sp.]|nr:hypothetical protein [Allosphingosinicella sp.]